MYTGVESKARASKKFYIGVENLARKVKKMYIGDADGKARLCYNRIFTWAKYTFYLVRTEYGFSSGDYNTSTSSESLVIWPPESRVADGSAIVDTGETDTSIGGTEYPLYKIVYGTDFSYNNSSGKFSLTGATEKELSVSSSNSNYGIEQTYIGKYVIYNNCAYKITDHDDVYSLILGEKYSRGDKDYIYKWRYDGDVTSEDENAYPSGNTPPEGYYRYDTTQATQTRYVKK